MNQEALPSDNGGSIAEEEMAEEIRLALAGEENQPLRLDDHRLLTVIGRIQSGDAAALSELTQAGTSYVAAIARRMKPINLLFEDAWQEGMIGLMRAAMHFKEDAHQDVDPQNHAKVTRSYCAKYIAGSIMTADAVASPITLPINQYWRARRLQRIGRRFYAANRRAPTDDELSEATGIAVDEVPILLAALQAPRSIDGAVTIDETGQPAHLMDIPDPVAETTLQRAELKIMVEQALARSGMTPNARRATRLYYALGEDEQDSRSLQGVGTQMGISRERVRQLLAVGELQIRYWLKEES